MITLKIFDIYNLIVHKIYKVFTHKPDVLITCAGQSLHYKLFRL